MISYDYRAGDLAPIVFLYGFGSTQEDDAHLRPGPKAQDLRLETRIMAAIFCSLFW